jgi:nitrilase
MSDALTLTLQQMAAGTDWTHNLETVRLRLRDSAGRCELVVFPENVLCLGRGATVLRQARPIGDLCAELGGLCREAGIAAVFGGVPVAESGKAMNSSLVFAADGNLLARYDKMHLFQLNPGYPGGIDETTTYGYGPSPVAFEFRGWRVALSICYDVRFPELYRALGEFDLLLCTAAFTRQTGQAHWEVLLRARAVENLCYVAGVGQCGANPETGTELFGNSLAVDPWGEVLARLEAPKPGTLTVTCRKARLEAVRATLPALDHRRFSIRLARKPGFGVRGSAKAVRGPEEGQR